MFFGVFDFGGKFILLWLLFVCGWVLDIGFYVKYDGGVFVFGFFEGIVGECGDFLGELYYGLGIIIIIIIIIVI